MLISITLSTLCNICLPVTVTVAVCSTCPVTLVATTLYRPDIAGRVLAIFRRWTPSFFFVIFTFGVANSSLSLLYQASFGSGEPVTFTRSSSVSFSTTSCQTVGSVSIFISNTKLHLYLSRFYIKIKQMVSNEQHNKI